MPGGDGVVIALEDTTEVARAQKLEAWTEAARRVAHEIKNPLTPIKLSAERMVKKLNAADPSAADAVREGAEVIIQEVNLLKTMVDQFSRFAKMPESHPTSTDLAALVENAIVAWRLTAESAGLTLDQRGPKSLLLNLDPVAIERVVSNLVSNAIKYTPRGGRVEVDLAMESDGVRLSVFDTGPGIDAELASRLFGRFERAHGSDRRKVGTGIGLALVKELVQAHDGTIAALPREPLGTEMRVVLPSSLILRDAAHNPVTRSRLQLGPTITSSLVSGDVFASEGRSEGTILLAEDNAVLAENIARMLSEDYKVIVALDGSEAAALIQKHQPHLLVTDVDMPGLNGIELSRKFRELTGDRLAPIIILSAVLDLGTRIAGLEAGAVDYVAKPFDPLELRARVRSQFRMRDLALRLHRAAHLSALGILTAGLAHELRNPANGIVNAVRPLKMLLPKDLMTPGQPINLLVDVMSTCATQIASLSQQLLSFRNGGADIDLRPASMQDIVDRAMTLARGALEGIEVRKTLAIDEPVSCAPSLLVQVLANLIENAGHAAGKGGWIAIECRAQSGRVTVEVADSGPGVPSALRERIFEPFFTTKAPGRGTGLGLPVARAIMLKHGGLLEIRERGDRPAFVIELPHKNIGAASNAV